MAFKTKKDLIKHCLTYPDVYEDYPFHDTEWAVIRHRKNKKVFAWIYTREEKTCVNVKCDPEWTEMHFRAFCPGTILIRSTGIQFYWMVRSRIRI